jgi:hypothetical protein
MNTEQPCRECLRHCLADAVRNTRLAHRLSVQRAARLAGLEVRQWIALEAAEWIPADGPELEAITSAVQGESITASFYAAVSRENQ